ncbi:ejaculatory bulb-specific protein 2 [Drosophila simulans]|uniref:GD24895 n=2 Tax=melanogaster subgroup TaxID=32351 RepID=B4QD66_DROSI|nr:ejaculatory bulb-specific protein 2 [Drosophila simulans]XP_033156848.1 ejaculatory bulb-specific protein 2 [Drosophila mauritiana]EDX08662.1 GD24895 [Drosophila simulans]KMY96531.1 uncharacterized protein Dsimw501_GD24895 [Drosophila simulans]
MIRILVLMITFTLMTGSALCSIEQLMRVFGGGSVGGGSRLDINRRVTIVPPEGDFSFGYGFRPGFY